MNNFIPKTEETIRLDTRLPQPTYFTIQTPFTKPPVATQTVYFNPGIDSTPKVQQPPTYAPGVKLSVYPQ